MPKVLKCLIFCLLAGLALAQDSPQKLLGDLERDEELTQEQWIVLLGELSDQKVSQRLEGFLAESEKFPKSAMVAALGNSQLAVRLGAVDLLEDAAGGTFGFNPWLNPNDPKNREPLENWNRWLKDDSEIQFGERGLDPTQIEIYLRAILSADRAKTSRALRKLETDRAGGLRAIQQFLNENPQLDANSRNKLRNGLYHLALSEMMGDGTERLARNLSFGSRDQQISALIQLRETGISSIPIVRDFVNSSDALIREAAIESLLILGGDQAVEWIEGPLRAESDVNVIHSAIRRLKKLGSPGKALIQKFINRPEEDLLVTVLESLINEDSYSNFGGRTGGAKTRDFEQKVIELLDDPRWRVRVAALTYVGKNKVRKASTKVLERLTDEDSFVRAKAVEAGRAVARSKISQRLDEVLKEHPEWFEELVVAITAAELRLPSSFQAKMDELSTEQLVSIVSSFDGSHLDQLMDYAEREELDLACAALRKLATYGEKNGNAQDILVAALRSGIDAKIQAVLDEITIEPPKFVDPRIRQQLKGIELAPKKETHLDPLYDAFLVPLRKAKDKGLAAPRPPKDADREALVEAVALHLNDKLEGRKAMAAARILLRANYRPVFQLLRNNLTALSVAQRRQLAEYLYTLSDLEGLPLATALMRDASSDVRSEAASNLMYEEDRTALISAVFKELDRTETPLGAHEIYGYRFESVARQSRSKRLIQAWARGILNGNSDKIESRVLALIGISRAGNSEDLVLVRAAIESEDPRIRRAAVGALGQLSTDELAAMADKISKDPNWRVREGLALALAGDPSVWTYWFNNEALAQSRFSSYNFTSNKGRRSLPEAATDALKKLASQDPKSEVRFEASLVLMSNRQSVPMDRFAKLVADLPSDRHAPERIARFLEINHSMLGEGFRPLVALADLSNISSNAQRNILAHFGGDKKQGMLVSSFEELTQLADATQRETQPDFVAPEVVQKVAVQELKLVYFYQTGCEKCAKARKMIGELEKELKVLNVVEYDILTDEGQLFNQALCARFNSTNEGKTPAVFLQEGYIVGDNLNPQALADLTKKSYDAEQDPDWASFTAPQREEAKQAIEKKVEAFTWATVLLAGLIDGVNPCAFATIIFLLSWLQVARRTPREILAVGLAFISAVFITYFALGLFLYQVIASLEGQVVWARRLLNGFFAIFALIIAILSFRDAVKAKRGQLEDMSLQLPGFLKDQIKTVVRKGAKARRFVLAAFLAGIVISLLELACTGQVYAPIIFQIRQGSEQALMLLLGYNVAFILPLVLVFIMAYRGMTSDVLIKFQKKHTAAIKVALGIIFLALFALLISQLF